MTPTLRTMAGYVHRLMSGDTRGRTDRELLDRFIAARDEAAFAELVRRHGSMVLAACRRVLRHHHDAEDVLQAAFLVLARKGDAIRGEALGGWLHQVAFRLALRARALARRREAMVASAPDLDVHAAAHPQSASPILLDEELQRLPEPYRSVVVLCYLEGRTQTETARQLATTPDAVNSRLKRARELLRRRLVERGVVMGAAAVADWLLTAQAGAALSTTAAQDLARIATAFTAAPGPASGASAAAVALAQGALLAMSLSKLKAIVSAAIAATLLIGILASGWLRAYADDGDPGAALAPVSARAPSPAAQPRGDLAKKPRSVILLWMGGGPSQLETFDPKPGHANGGPFDAIDTSVKGLRIGTLFPKLAEQAHHLAIFRTVSHRDPDHGRGAYLMRTGYTAGGANDHPALACILAKELGRAAAPGYIRIGQSFERLGSGPGFLGEKHAALPIAVKGGVGDPAFSPPPLELFETRAKGKGDEHRKLVEKALDRTAEKQELVAAYGPSPFGQGCLVARRLVEQGVPVVEVALEGWDMHQNIAAAMPRLAATLDAGMAALLKDLADRKLLDTTLVVWMGEFGRTPRLNAGGGRDHWSMNFSVVLAGAGVKGGQAIGQTSDDGTAISARPVRVPELMATICRAVGVDGSKTHLNGLGQEVPIVEKGAEAVKEALR